MAVVAVVVVTVVVVIVVVVVDFVVQIHVTVNCADILSVVL